MKSARLKTPSGKKTPLRFRPPPKDPVEVYCRLRPLTNNEIPCVWQASETTVCIMPPANSQVFNKGSAKESTYVFKRVFNENISQEEVFNCVALPLVKDLLNGKSGLLFTYGITSSGKTFTMTGSPTDCGILPRCIDVIFASLLHLQTKKYVFRPDGANNFEIVPTPEVLLQEHMEKINPKTPKAKRRDDSDDWSQRVVETTKVDSLEEDYGYSIFVSYIEIYNNYIYDLLEDISGESGKGKKSISSKNLREDKRQFMYVNGGTEVEVKSAEDTFEVLCKGVKRRRIAHTALNAESSRSHSVFTIRVVKAPLDPRGEEVLPNPEFIVVSQLSLVDLAGSERSSRTRGDQDRIREAGSINNSLLTLRNCIEILRENQKQGTSKVVPYRESKLTHLFRNFFDGEGRVRMIICVNPRPEDHDETVHVMKFGELTQEVCVNRPMGHPPLAPMFMPYGRGSRTFSSEFDGPSSLMYCIRPAIPSMILRKADDATSIPQMIQILRERKQHRELVVNDFMSRKDELRMRLAEMEIEFGSLQQRNILMEKELEEKANQIKRFEERLSQTEYQSEELQRRLREQDSNKMLLERELDLKCQQLNEADNAKTRMKAQLQERLMLEREQMKRIMEKRLAEKQAELEVKMCLTDEKFRQLREILNSDDDWGFLTQEAPLNMPNTRSTEVKKRYNLRSSAGGVKERREATGIKEKREPVKRKNLGIPAANPCHSRSHSEGAQVWIEHRPAGSVDTGTIFQPAIKKRKSVSKLKVKDIKESSKYVLMHQEQNPEGEVATHLFKGNVIPSAGGGAQVIFKDVETVHQKSPLT